jgi:hypothetical protein
VVEHSANFRNNHAIGPNLEFAYFIIFPEDRAKMVHWSTAKNVCMLLPITFVLVSSWYRPANRLPSWMLMVAMVERFYAKHANCLCKGIFYANNIVLITNASRIIVVLVQYVYFCNGHRLYLLTYGMPKRLVIHDSVGARVVWRRDSPPGTEVFYLIVQVVRVGGNQSTGEAVLLKNEIMSLFRDVWLLTCNLVYLWVILIWLFIELKS